MRTILTVDHETRIIQPAKLQYFHGNLHNLISITEIETDKLLKDSNRFTRYTRKYSTLKEKS